MEGLVELTAVGVGGDVPAQDDGEKVLARAGLLGLGGLGAGGLAAAAADRLQGLQGVVEAALDGKVAVGGHHGDLLGKLGLEHVEPQQRRREVRADAHEVVLGAAATAQLAALEVEELVGHELALGGAAGGGVVVDGMGARDG